MITENDNFECFYSATQNCVGQVVLRDVDFSHTPIALCERHYIMTMAQHKVSEECNTVE